MSLPVPPYFGGTEGAQTRDIGEKRDVLDLILTTLIALGGAGSGVLANISLSAGWQPLGGSPAYGIPQYSVLGSLVILQGAVEVVSGTASNGDQIGSVPTGASGAAPDVKLRQGTPNLHWDIHPDGSITYESWDGFTDYLLLNAVYRKGGS
jgi:hypothetical protein